MRTKIILVLLLVVLSVTSALPVFAEEVCISIEPPPNDVGLQPNLLYGITWTEEDPPTIADWVAGWEVAQGYPDGWCYDDTEMSYEQAVQQIFDEVQAEVDANQAEQEAAEQGGPATNIVASTTVQIVDDTCGTFDVNIAQDSVPDVFRITSAGGAGCSSVSWSITVGANSASGNLGSLPSGGVITVSYVGWAAGTYNFVVTYTSGGTVTTSGGSGYFNPDA